MRVIEALEANDPIKFLAYVLNMPGKDIAKEMDIDRSLVSKWLTGEVPVPEHQQKLAKAVIKKILKSFPKQHPVLSVRIVLDAYRRAAKAL